MRIPTVCVVFGSSTAGGAYQPGLSDYIIVVKEQSKIFLGGPPLVKMATGEETDDETLGGAEMHADVSGLGDYLAVDELDAIRMCREIVSHLNWRKPGPGPIDADPTSRCTIPRSCSGSSPRPEDSRSTCATSSPAWSTAPRFEEFKARYGPTLVCGWASIHGFPVGILGNNGVLFPEARGEGRPVHPAVQPDRRAAAVPAEHHRLHGRAATTRRRASSRTARQMINAVSNSTVPHVTVMVGASATAPATTACRGRAFGNRFMFLWPTAKIAVMGPKQIAGVMSIVRRGPGRAQGRGVRRGGRRQDRRGGRGRPGGGLAGAATPRARQRRRHHRSTRTRAPWSGCACPSCATSRSRAPRASGCSGCECHVRSARCSSPTAARSPAGSSAPPRSMGIRCVAVYVDADRDAPFVAEADDAVRLPDAATSTSAGRRRGPRAPAPTPSIPATDSCRRTPPSRRRSSTPASTWVGPAPERDRGAWATSWPPSDAAMAARCPTLPSTEDVGAAGRRSATRCSSRRPPVVAARACASSSAADDLDEAVAAARREARQRLR